MKKRFIRCVYEICDRMRKLQTCTLSILKRMDWNGMKWFGHMERMAENAIIRVFRWEWRVQGGAQKVDG